MSDLQHKEAKETKIAFFTSRVTSIIYVIAITAFAYIAVIPT